MIRAPGKAFLFGEYAVLHGGVGCVAGITRYASAHRPHGPARRESPFVFEARVAARELAHRRGLRWQDSRVEVDTSHLYGDGKKKLGLGSSAATCVASMGSMLARCGADLSDPALRAELLPLAVQAHDRAQRERGSGGDVAAAIAGGIQRVEVGQNGPEVQKWAFPAKEWVLQFVYVGMPASTGPLVAAVRRALAKGQGGVCDVMQEMVELSRAFAEEDPGLEDFEIYGELMGRLGSCCGMDILTPEHAMVRDLARRVGGVAKPSGAGGGDLALCVLPTVEARDALVRSIASTGLLAVDLEIDRCGLHEMLPGDVL